MVKKLFSFLSVNKGRPTKKRDSKKGRLLNRVLHYLKSDNYMYAPLLPSKYPSFPSSTGVGDNDISKNEPKKLIDKVKKYMLSDCYMYAPFLDKPRLRAGVQEIENSENEPKKLMDKVKDYMLSDCYMYAPLLFDEPRLRAGSLSSSETAGDTSRLGDATKIVTENARDIRQNTKSTSISNQRVAEYPLTRKTIIKNTMLQRETVEHVIQQNGATPSAKGDEKQEKWGKKRTKINGSTTNAKRRRKAAAS